VSIEMNQPMRRMRRLNGWMSGDDYGGRRFPSKAEDRFMIARKHMLSTSTG
jgi:hypothetical protein